MSRYLSFKGLVTVCALYAFGAFVIQVLQGNLDIAALAPLFTGKGGNAVLPQPGDPQWMLPIRLMGLGTIFLTFTGMFVFLMVQSFLPVTISMLLITVVLRKIGTHSYWAFALGGLVCGGLMCAVAFWLNWQLNNPSRIYIILTFGMGAVIYRAIVGKSYPEDPAPSVAS